MANRVVPFILEGSTDAESLADLLARAVRADLGLRELCVGGDLTIYQIHPRGYRRLNPADPFSAVRAAVMDDMERLGEYRPSDIAAVIQLTDLDGAMIGDDRIVRGARLEYRTDSIATPDPAGIRRRNAVKTANIRRLSRPGATVAIRGRRIPYLLFYCSRNLEHALYGETAALTPREKTRRSLEFQRRHADDPQGLPAVLGSDAVLHGMTGYDESWRWPFGGTHSLERGSNIALMPRLLAEAVPKARPGRGRS